MKKAKQTQEITIPKTKEEYEIASLKESIKRKKERFDEYIELLIEYGLKENHIAVAPIYWDRLWKKEMNALYDKISTLKLPRKKEEKMRMKYWHKLFWEGKTEKERLESQEKHWNQRLWFANHMVDSLPEETKKKIIRNAVNRHLMWNEAFDNHHRLIEDLSRRRKATK